MIMPKLLLATNNKGKLEELRVLLKGIPFTMIAPAECGLSLDVEESGKTYAANARIKATLFANTSGLLTLADDSGLEVTVLGGAPGVLSSRYAGPGADDEKRVAFLLEKMRGIPVDERDARFKCVIAIALPYGSIKTCSGSCRGIISTEPRGTNGFGYDPVFYLPGFDRTMAELPQDIKNSISHRARAAAAAKKILFGMAHTGDPVCQ